MNVTTVTVVRIYLSEGKGELRGLLAKLHDEEKVRGLTVFRGVSGFWSNGKDTLFEFIRSIHGFANRHRIF